MTSLPVQRSQSPVVDAQELIPMTLEEMENEVGSISAEDITAIARTVLHKVMDLMGIDAPRTRFTGRALCDQKGELIGQEIVTEPHRETEARKQFALLALPLVERHVASAFSTPGAFVENGTRLPFIGRDDTAFVNQMKKQCPGAFVRILNDGCQSLLKRMSHFFEMECIGYGVTLKLNQEVTAKSRELYFDVTDAMSHRGYTLKSFREEAQK